MISWPDLGTRVTVRYRRPTGSAPPLTDAVGHLLTVDPVVRVQTKTGAVVEFATDDAVALRVLTDVPVRTSQIRALEHAAAAARTGGEHAWLDGWLLQAGHGTPLAANSAVPLDVSARLHSVPAVAAWYEHRGLTPWLALPDRLLTVPPRLVGQHAQRVLVRDLSARQPDPGVTWPDRPERMALTEAPDGTRWVRLSLLRMPNDESAAQQCEALLSRAVDRGATRGYAEVDDGDDAAAGLAARLGFRLHHGRRYLQARPGGWDTV